MYLFPQRVALAQIHETDDFVGAVKAKTEIDRELAIPTKARKPARAQKADVFMGHVKVKKEVGRGLAVSTRARSPSCAQTDRKRQRGQDLREPPLRHLFCLYACDGFRPK